MGFEPTILASERAKTVHALDRSATVTGHRKYIQGKYKIDFIRVYVFRKYNFLLNLDYVS
jgi:hypothetical protein